MGQRQQAAHARRACMNLQQQPPHLYAARGASCCRRPRRRSCRRRWGVGRPPLPLRRPAVPSAPPPQLPRAPLSAGPAAAGAPPGVCGTVNGGGGGEGCAGGGRRAGRAVAERQHGPMAPQVGGSQPLTWSFARCSSSVSCRVCCSCVASACTFIAAGPRPRAGRGELGGGLQLSSGVPVRRHDCPRAKPWAAHVRAHLCTLPHVIVPLLAPGHQASVLGHLCSRVGGPSGWCGTLITCPSRCAPTKCEAREPDLRRSGMQ